MRIYRVRSRPLMACRKAVDICMRVMYWLPVLFVTAVILWGYYVYMYVMNISGAFPKASPVINVLLILVGNVLLGLQLVSYFRAIYTVHKPIPDQFHLSDEHVERLEENGEIQAVLQEVAEGLPIHTVTVNGGIRYCPTCEAVKPDRCHHCSICNRCVLKMDHHCPWINNCVGYSNYKFFVLFLFYTCVICVWFCLTGLYDFMRSWSDTLHIQRGEKFNVIFCFFISLMFGFSTSFLLIFHIYLSFVNRSTIENMRSPLTSEGGGTSDRRLFYMGVRRNLAQVFGTSLLKAFLPISTSLGDGVKFPLRHGSHSGVESGDAVMMSQVDHERTQSRHTRHDDEPQTSGSGEDSEVEILAQGVDAHLLRTTNSQ